MTLLSAALLCACTVGEAPTVDGGGGSNGADHDVCEPRAATIAPAHNHTAAPTGARAKTGCMDAGCHSTTGAGSTSFAFAGTVYKETAAVTPATGVTVRIFKPPGKTSLAEAVTDDAGNFVIRNPGMFTDFPYETHVTVCGVSTTIRPMIGPIPMADANCNTGGSCHGNGGGQGAIYLAD